MENNNNKPDQIADVTDESVAEETLVVNEELKAEFEETHPVSHNEVEDMDESFVDESFIDAEPEEVEAVEIEEPVAVEIEEAADSIVDEDLYPEFVLPPIRRSFRGYNMDDIDNHVLPLVEEFNKIQKARSMEAKHMDDLTAEVARLIARVEELENFNINDVVEGTINEAQHEAKVIIHNATEKAKKIVATSREKTKQSVAKTNAKKNEILDKAKRKAEEITTKANDKLQNSEQILADEMAKIHAQGDEIKNKAKEKAEIILAKAKEDVKNLKDETKAELAEAKKYIAKRHEVHNRLQDFYKAQSDLLSNRE